MTSVTSPRIEALVTEMWRDHRLEPGFDAERLLDALDLGLLWEEIPDEAGGRIYGQVVPEERLVMLNEAHRARLEANHGRLRRFTLGHEIGHWLLHCGTGGVRSRCQGGRPVARERQAEEFSAALLMPEDRVLPELPASPWRGWPQVYRLADAFLVSATAMARRLEELGCMRRDLRNVPVSGRLRPAAQDALFG